MQTLHLKNTEGKILTVNFINIHELFIQSVIEHYGLWFDKTIDPLFQVLWDYNMEIYVMNTLTDSECKEIKNELKKIGLEQKAITCLFNDLNKPPQKIIAQQGDNVVAVSGYYLPTMTPFTSFSTLTHELVHYIDQIICGEESVYTRLEELNNGKLKVYRDASEEILNIIEKEKANVDLFKTDIDIVDAKNKTGGERLTYCVQAYVTALMVGRKDIVENMSTYIKIMSDTLLSLKGKY